MMDSTTTTENNLDDFVSQLLIAKTGEDSPVEHSELFEKINSKIDQAILTALPETDFNRVEELANSGASEDEIRAILDGANLDTETIITRALVEFRDEYLGVQNAQ